MRDNNKSDLAILYVDDEEKALKYFSKALADRFNVLTASDVAAAEAILEAEGDRIAVVVSDQRMPGKNGVELLKKVRSEYPTVVRLLTTAYSDLNDAIDAINRGEIYRYIQKPWKVESLQAEVAGAMDYFLLRRERDLLLAEKLSARQRMSVIERISQLIVFSRSFNGLRNADYAVKGLLQQLHRLPGAWESDGISRVDQWELTKWETKRITDYVRTATDSLLDANATADQFDDVLTRAQLVELNRHKAESAGRALKVEEVAGTSPEWHANRALVEKLVDNIFAAFSLALPGNQSITLQLIQGSELQAAPGTTLRFHAEGPDWPGDRHLLCGSALTGVHPLYCHLLCCALAAAHHGGECTIGLSSDLLEIVIDLPVSGASASLLPDLDWEWLPDVLALYEPDIDEFYHDL